MQVRFFTNYEDLKLDDFENNPKLSIQENQEIKRCIIDAILYVSGYNVDYNNILSVIDEEVSKDWFAKMFAQVWYYEEGWTIADELCHLKKGNSDFRLSGIQTNFMMRYYFTEYNELQVSVPIYRMYMGKSVGYVLYDFYLKNIDGKYKIIGITVG